MGLFRCRDLLEVNTGASVITSTVFNLKKATESVTKIIELLCREKNIKVFITYEDGLCNAKFQGDVIKYQQVLLNVLKNACKFNPPNCRVEIRIACTTLKNLTKDDSEIPSLLSVIVKDFGHGIDKQDQTQIFKPFASVRSQSTNQ